MDTRVLVVMGVSGSGKSTLGRLLAQQLGGAFGEGDELHPAANVATMRAGQPLTDADRWPWLARVHDWIVAHLHDRRPAVISCSALRRSYRDVLREPGVLFVYLHGGHDLLAARLAARQGHFMPAGLLDSQLATLEPPAPDEHAVSVDVQAAPDVQVQQVLDLLGS